MNSKNHTYKRVPRHLSAAGLVFQKYCISQNYHSFCGSCRCRLVEHCNFSWKNLTAAFCLDRYMGGGCSAAQPALWSQEGQRQSWSGCEVKEEGWKWWKLDCFRCCLRLTCDSLTWILLFISVASEHGSYSVPRPDIWGREGAEGGKGVDWEML